MILDKERFAKLCEEYGTIFYNGSIGTYNEKRLHLVLKHLVSSDTDTHEVKLGKCIADVFDGERITEIQTGSLYPLKKKLDYYLSGTDYPITVIKTFVSSKRVVRVDRESGELMRCRKSPKKEGDAELYRELYYISEHLSDERLEVLALFIDADEYRYSDEAVRFRKSGKYDSELFPRELSAVKSFCGKSSFEYLLEDVTNNFSAKDFSELHNFKGRSLYSALNLLCKIGLIKREKSEKGAYTYTLLNKTDKEGG